MSTSGILAWYQGRGGIGWRLTFGVREHRGSGIDGFMEFWDNLREDRKPSSVVLRDYGIQPWDRHEIQERFAAEGIEFKAAWFGPVWSSL